MFANELSGWLAPMLAWWRPTLTAPVVIDRSKEVAVLKTCRDCHTSFPITAGEIVFLESKGWQLFKRCEPCRRKKRLLKEMGITR